MVERAILAFMLGYFGTSKGAVLNLRIGVELILTPIKGAILVSMRGYFVNFKRPVSYES